MCSVTNDPSPLRSDECGIPPDADETYSAGLLPALVERLQSEIGHSSSMIKLPVTPKEKLIAVAAVLCLVLLGWSVYASLHPPKSAFERSLDESLAHPIGLEQKP